MKSKGSRRNFFVLAIHGLGAIIAGALGIPGLVYLLAPSKLKSETPWIDIGDASKLPDGEPAEVVFRRRRVDGWKVIDEKTSAWVVKKSDTDIFALGPKCTHLGCAYHWEKDKKEFLCPCHTSTFALDGKVTSGPAPRPLDRYALRLINGRVQLGQVEISEG